MAVTAATLTSDFNGIFLPMSIAQPIFDQAAQSSVAQRLGTQIPVGPNGVAIPITTGEIVAEWVDEAAPKPLDNTAVSVKTLTPKKLAVIVVMSAEVVRANPAQFVNTSRRQMGEAFAKAFDAAVMHGTNNPFANYLDQTSKAAEIGAHTAAEGGVYQDLVTALDLIVSDNSAVDGGAAAYDRQLTGWAFDNVMEPNMLGSVDANGRPLFVDLPSNDLASPQREGRVMGRPAIMGRGVATSDKTTVVGYAGDWSQVVWGVTSGITYSISTETALTINGSLVSLWERNLVAVRAEAEYGFLINDLKSFVRLTNDTGS